MFFFNLSGLREHEKLHIPIETSCTLCEDMLSSEWNLRDHMKLFHRKHSWSFFPNFIFLNTK